MCFGSGSQTLVVGQRAQTASGAGIVDQGLEVRDECRVFSWLANSGDGNCSRSGCLSWLALNRRCDRRGRRRQRGSRRHKIDANLKGYTSAEYIGILDVVACDNVFLRAVVSYCETGKCIARQYHIFDLPYARRKRRRRFEHSSWRGNGDGLTDIVLAVILRNNRIVFEEQGNTIGPKTELLGYSFEQITFHNSIGERPGGGGCKCRRGCGCDRRCMSGNTGTGRCKRKGQCGGVGWEERANGIISAAGRA